MSFTMTPESDIDPDFSYTGTLSFTFKFPDTGVVVFTPGIAYVVKVAVFIEGEDFSSSIQGSVNVTREDNSAATFDITINSSQKAAEFLNDDITIAFQVADESGIVVDYIPIFRGVITTAQYNVAEGAYNLTGYDYGGFHSIPGELISANVTPVLTGSISITGTGTFTVGFAPIWGVTYLGTDDIEDGRDFFVNSLNGNIEVPVTSNFNDFPGALQFSYAVPFATLKGLIEDVAARKSWSLTEEGVTLVDYTAITKQPVLSVSDESVVDTVRKLLELSGAKVDTNLFPDMRIYSDTNNLVGADDHVIDETDYYEESLDINISLDGLITEQTVRSVSKTLENIVVSGSEELADKDGTAAREMVLQQFVFTQEDVDNLLEMVANMSSKVIVEVRIRKANIFSLSHTAGGTTIPVFTPNIVDIQDSDWVQTIDGEDVLYSLVMNPLIEFITAQAYISYPGANWELTVNGTRIEYGEGTIEETVEVTGTRDVTGITGPLVGDVYENPYIETAAHAGNIVNAMLTEFGNIYEASCQVPIHKGAAMNIGDKINIQESSSTIFKGLIKELNYNLNTDTANSPVGIRASGVGIGI